MPLEAGTTTNTSPPLRCLFDEKLLYWQNLKDRVGVSMGYNSGWRQTKLKLLHNQVAVYSAGSPLVWIEVEGGELPTPRIELRATVVNNVLYLSGGFDGDKELTTVLSWDPAGQTWQEVGNLAVGRDFHAAVAVPESFIDCK